MKRMIIITISLWMICLSATNAQVVFGVRAGLSRPTLGSSAGSSLDGKFGLEVGPVLYYSLKDNFYINSGIMYSMKTFVEEMDDGYDDYYRGEANLSYIDIPLYVGYNIPVGKFQTYAQAGPYIGFKLSAKDRYLRKKGGSYSEWEDIPLTSFNAGIGVMYGINISQFKIEAGYQYGLLNILDEGNGSVDLSALFIGVSYVF
jgi:hypothetical protein